MSNLEISDTKILFHLQQLTPKTNFLNQKRQPQLPDIELITPILVAECLGIDSERDLFRCLPKSLSLPIGRPVYNQGNYKDIYERL